MPPATEKYQNCVGTTLVFSRSEASHCTKKRPKNNSWPMKPMVIQIRSARVGEPSASHTCSVVMPGVPFPAEVLGGFAEHRPEDIVGLADVLETASPADEREDLFRFLARHRLLLVGPDVGEVTQR